MDSRDLLEIERRWQELWAEDPTGARRRPAPPPTEAPSSPPPSAASPDDPPSPSTDTPGDDSAGAPGGESHRADGEGRHDGEGRPEDAAPSESDAPRPDRDRRGRERRRGERRGRGRGRRQRFFCLDMFPYPSVDGFSVNQLRGIAITDVVARYQEARGKEVLRPMGWDSFGLSIEQEAQARGVAPQQVVEDGITVMRDQLQRFGTRIDWDRELSTCDPEFYRWTQWLFLRMLEKDLAYRQETPIRWCPTCEMNLSNEEAHAGRCLHCDKDVEERRIPQWLLRTTRYAERLHQGLRDLKWPRRVKSMQRNWIGRREGFELILKARNEFLYDYEELSVFVRRLEWLPAATYVVLCPEHPLVDVVTDELYVESVAEYREEVLRMTERERLASGGVPQGRPTGAFVLNPVNLKQIPIWVSAFVLPTVRFGAVLGIPGHDDRHREFAEHFGLHSISVVTRRKLGKRRKDRRRKDGRRDSRRDGKRDGGRRGDGGERREAERRGKGKSAAPEYEEVLMNCGPLSGMPVPQAVRKIRRDLEARHVLSPHVDYHLRDWIFARQRFWGEPIPVVYEEDGTIVAVPDEDLPVELPRLDAIPGAQDGRSPLESIEEFRSVEMTFPEEAEDAPREEEAADVADDPPAADSSELEETVSPPAAESADPLAEASAPEPASPKGSEVSFGAGLDIDDAPAPERKPADGGESSIGSAKETPSESSDEAPSESSESSEEQRTDVKVPRDRRERRRRRRDRRGSQKRDGREESDRKESAAGRGESSRREPQKPTKEPLDTDPEAAPPEDTRDAEPRRPATRMMRRETDTMPQWAASCWYYLRYLGNQESDAPYDKDEGRKWLPVDLCVGGIEHAILHLLYVRFISYFLHDIGMTRREEPFRRLFNQGRIYRADPPEEVKRIPTHRGDRIGAQEVIERFGNDVVRLHLLFLAPPVEDVVWSESGLRGCRRFLRRCIEVVDARKDTGRFVSRQVLVEKHRLIRAVTQAIRGMRLNKAISAFMEFIKFLRGSNVTAEEVDRATLKVFAVLLAPFAPHVAAELWQKLGGDGSVFDQDWPDYSTELLKPLEVEIGVMIDGRIRDRFIVEGGIPRSDLLHQVHAREKVLAALAGRSPRRTIVVPDRLVKFVIEEASSEAEAEAGATDGGVAPSADTADGAQPPVAPAASSPAPSPVTSTPPATPPGEPGATPSDSGQDSPR